MRYYVLVLDGVPAAGEELISDLCFSAGATGVSEDLEFKVSPETYEPVTVDRSTKTLKVYFHKEPSLELVEQLKKEWPQINVDMQAQPLRDWQHEWKRHFKPLQLTSEIWVVPSWETIPTQAKKVISMDPGMAFGTGTHETTQLLAELLSEAPANQPLSVLDVGTGTAVLAMLCVHLGVKSVVGIDIDLEALRVARENVEKNLMGEVVQISDLAIGQVKGSFDWIVANIIDGVLLKLKPDFERLVAPGGHLFLSGILTERLQSFTEEFLDAGDFSLVKHKVKGEWVALHLVHQ